MVVLPRRAPPVVALALLLFLHLVVLARPPLERVRLPVHARAARALGRLLGPVVVVAPVRHAGDRAPAPAVLAFSLVLLFGVRELRLLLSLPLLVVVLATLMRARLWDVNAAVA